MASHDYDDEPYGCGICGAPLNGFSELCGTCEALSECALGQDGQCMKAGSEECDWECPNSHVPLYAGSNAWHLRHRSLPVDDCECSKCREALNRQMRAV